MHNNGPSLMQRVGVIDPSLTQRVEMNFNRLMTEYCQLPMDFCAYFVPLGGNAVVRSLTPP
jgi:hypothetical protein